MLAIASQEVLDALFDWMPDAERLTDWMSAPFWPPFSTTAIAELLFRLLSDFWRFTTIWFDPKDAGAERFSDAIVALMDSPYTPSNTRSAATVGNRCLKRSLAQNG